MALKKSEGGEATAEGTQETDEYVQATVEGDQAISSEKTEIGGVEQQMDNTEEQLKSPNSAELPDNPSQTMQTPKQNPDVEEKILSLKRRRGGQPGRKKGDSRINKPRTSDSCIKNRCIVKSAMFWFHSQVFHRLHRDHIRVLARTPFMHLFAFPNITQANNAILHSILLKWDSAKGGFWFSNKLLKFTPIEVSLVMGLGFEGEVVNYKGECITCSNLRHKFFQKRNEKITRKELEDAIIGSLDKNY